MTPLHRAAAQNHVELCGFLIECKANVNATDRYLAHILKKKKSFAIVPLYGKSPRTLSCQKSFPIFCKKKSQNVEYHSVG